MVKFAALSSVFAALLGATLAAASAPRLAPTSVHYQRFLQEKGALVDELAAWKASEAGQYAKNNGFYTDMATLDDADDTHLEDQLLRLFETKLSIEQVQQANPEATFGLETPFSLMTDAEFAAYVNASNAMPVDDLMSLSAADQLEVANDNDDDEDDGVGAAAPMAVTPKDWTTGKCVAPVKNQGSCGSCWAFAATAALESAVCIKSNKLTLFSEQYMTSCDGSNSGCNGGWPSNALNFARNTRMMCTAASYPYKSGGTGKTGTCASACTPYTVKINSVVNVAATGAAFRAAINKQPIAVTVAAGNNAWKQYTSGVVGAYRFVCSD